VDSTPTGDPGRRLGRLDVVAAVVGVLFLLAFLHHRNRKAPGSASA